MLFTKKTLEFFNDYFKYDFYEKITVPKYDEGNKKEIVIADLHIPFHKKDLFEEVSRLKANKITIIGDLWDFFSRSRFKKRTNPPISFKDEFREGFMRLKELARNYPQVNLMLANHDNRLDKYLYDNASPEILPFCRTGILEDLINTIPNVNIIKQKVNEHRQVGYIHQCKNIIFTHIEKSNIDITKTVQEINKIIFKWNNTYNLKPYDIIIQAHNHTAGMVIQGNIKLIQCPCMIDISSQAFDYIFDGKMSGNPPTLGYITLNKLDNGFYDKKNIQITEW